MLVILINFIGQGLLLLIFVLGVLLLPHWTLKILAFLGYVAISVTFNYFLVQMNRRYFMSK